MPIKDPMIYLKSNPLKHYLTKEQLAEQFSSKNLLKIGIPKEVAFEECRVPLAPESVGMLVQQGHQIVFQEDAGTNAGFRDAEYLENGARVTNNTAEIFNSDVVLKVSPPTAAEIELLDNRKLIISALNFYGRDKEYFQSLAKKKVTAISYEHIREKTGRLPLMQSLSEIIGSGAILIAAELLSDKDFGKGVILGGFPGITPTEVVIIGAGTVAIAAARAALNMGALVKVFDDNVDKLRTLTTELGNSVFTSILQPKVILKALKCADVAIGAIRPLDGHAPFMVSEDMVAAMKPGSVVIDVSIDQGGVFETSRLTSHHEPTFVKHNVVHFCVPNIASRYARTSSYALSNYFTPFLMRLGDYTNINQFILNEHGLMDAIYFYQGILTHHEACKKFNLPGQDISLLLAAL